MTGYTATVHISSGGNYNEVTAGCTQYQLPDQEHMQSDVSEFFNVIWVILASSYRNLITSPRDMRDELCRLVREADHATPARRDHRKLNSSGTGSLLMRSVSKSDRSKSS